MDISQYTQFIVFSSSKNSLLGISSKSMESGVNTWINVSKEYAFENLSRTQMFYEYGNDNKANNYK